MRGLGDLDDPSVVDDGEARRVIAPILESSQAFEDRTRDIPGADCSHDPAHTGLLLPAPRADLVVDRA